VADSYPLKLLRLQNKVLRTTGNLQRHTPSRDLRMSFEIPYLCDFVTELWMEQAIVTLNREIVNIHTIGQGEARHEICKRLKLGGQAYDRSVV
jgi:hypothetical protein